MEVNNRFVPTIQRRSPVAFSGRICVEKFISDTFELTKRKELIQETAFFRQIESLEFVKDYFKNMARKIKILTGACSSGEEAWTLKMLLGEKADVSGFDLGANAVAKAQKGEFVITKAKQLYEDGCDAFKDNFLVFSPQKSSYKNLFETYFEQFEPPKQPVLKKRTSKWDDWTPDGSISKNFKVKDDKKELVSFVQGDILKLNNVADKESADVLTFRNALYHLTTRRGPLGFHIPIDEAKMAPVLDKLVSNVRDVLKPNGLFVLGCHSMDHTKESGKLIYKTLKAKGFSPVFFENKDMATVWRKNA